MFRTSVRNSLPLDLHVLGTPPAFILSQDQTLHKKESVKASVEQDHRSDQITDIILKTVQIELTLIRTTQFLKFDFKGNQIQGLTKS